MTSLCTATIEWIHWEIVYTFPYICIVLSGFPFLIFGCLSIYLSVKHQNLFSLNTTSAWENAVLKTVTLTIHFYIFSYFYYQKYMMKGGTKLLIVVGSGSLQKTATYVQLISNQRTLLAENCESVHSLWTGLESVHSLWNGLISMQGIVWFIS